MSPTSFAAVELTAPAFVFAVAVLLLNDWVLKPAFGNWLTGKLSDFAGLAAFAMFWAALLPRRRRSVFLLTGAAFMFWKSPLSQPVLDGWNATGIWPITRVADYSDWIALAVLVPAYRAIRGQQLAGSAPPGGATSLTGSDKTSRRSRWARRTAAVLSAGTAIVAFSATSIVRPQPVTGIEYTIAASWDEVLAGLDSIGIPVARRARRSELAWADTATAQIRQPPERWISVTFEVREAGRRESRITLLGIIPGGPAPSEDALRRAFLAQVVEPLESWSNRR